MFGLRSRIAEITSILDGIPNAEDDLGSRPLHRSDEAQLESYDHLLKEAKAIYAGPSPVLNYQAVLPEEHKGAMQDQVDTVRRPPSRKEDGLQPGILRTQVQHISERDRHAIRKDASRLRQVIVNYTKRTEVGYFYFHKELELLEQIRKIALELYKSLDVHETVAYRDVKGAVQAVNTAKRQSLPARSIDSLNRTLLKAKRGLSGFANGSRISAFPDTGSTRNVVSEAFARELKLDVEGSPRQFKLGNS